MNTNTAPLIKDKDPVYTAFQYRWYSMSREAMPKKADNKLALAIEKYIPLNALDEVEDRVKDRAHFYAVNENTVRQLFEKVVDESPLYVVHQIDRDQIWNGENLLEEVRF